MMRRLAYLSPVNPVPSGISDYSEELLPWLAQYARMTLYVDDSVTPSTTSLKQICDIRPLSRLEADHHHQPYDALLYHVGNSPAHSAIVATLQRVPGVVVLHDVVLHHLFLHEAANVRRDIGYYQREAQRRYGAAGAEVAELMLRGRLTDGAFALPFYEEVLNAAEGLITHSQYAQQQALHYRPTLSTAVVPMGVPLPPLIDRDDARRQLGLSPDHFILASFGHVNPYKRIESVLRALRTLRRTYPAHYLLVGSVSASYNLDAAINRAGLRDAVTVTGYVSREQFELYVAASDICLNLRHPTAGETSASLLRLLGAGRPTLVTASGSFTELPVGVAAQVDPDASEGDLIIAYCELLANQPTLATALGTNARHYVANQHQLAQAAAGYWNFLSQRYGWTEAPPTIATVQPAAASEQVASPSQPARTVASTPTIDPNLSITAQALDGIGATEDDTTLLRTVAKALQDLQ